MVLVELVQVGTGAVVDKQWSELLARHIPLQMLVIFQVLRSVFIDIGVDVLGRLLTANAKALHQVVRGQPTLPPGHRLDEAIAQRQIPAYRFDLLLAFHSHSICSKTLPVRVNTLDA